jgi:hypothetical protein
MTKERAMTKEKSFKRRVRERMSKTGGRYATARSQVVQRRDRLESARLADTADRPSDDKVADVTGKKWDTWFAILDRWGAGERAHGETAAHLMAEHAVPGWWAQAITMWYQRSRGLRLKHQQADGFTVYASKAIAVAPEFLFDAFVNPESRQGWLADGSMSLRTAQPDGSTRVNVSFDGKGPVKTTVAVAHERLADPDEAELAKAAWRERLTALKKYVEAR